VATQFIIKKDCRADFWELEPARCDPWCSRTPVWETLFVPVWCYHPGRGKALMYIYMREFIHVHMYIDIHIQESFLQSQKLGLFRCNDIVKDVEKRWYIYIYISMRYFTHTHAYTCTYFQELSLQFPKLGLFLCNAVFIKGVRERWYTFIYTHICVCVHIYTHMIFWKCQLYRFRNLVCSGVMLSSKWWKVPKNVQVYVVYVYTNDVCKCVYSYVSLKQINQMSAVQVHALVLFPA